MLYERHKAPGALKLRFHIRDKFGNDIERSLDYDPQTGVGHRYVPGSDAAVTLEYFMPGGYVEVDGHVNPSQEALEAIYKSVEEGVVMPNKEVMDKIIKKVEQDVRFRRGEGTNATITNKKRLV